MVLRFLLVLRTMLRIWLSRIMKLKELGMRIILILGRRWFLVILLLGLLMVFLAKLRKLLLLLSSCGTILRIIGVEIVGTILYLIIWCRLTKKRRKVLITIRFTSSLDELDFFRSLNRLGPEYGIRYAEMRKDEVDEIYIDGFQGSLVPDKDGILRNSESLLPVV